MIAADDDW